jgi:hypothetical protein
MRVRSLFVVGLTLWPALAASQPAPQSSGPEAMGTVAVSQLWDDESRLGTGFAGGGGFGYRWHGHFGVEARVEGFTHDRTFSSGVRFQAHGIRVLGQAAYYWTDRNVQPFAAGTFGVMKVKQRNEYPIQQPGPTGLPIVTGIQVFEGDHTEMVWGGGGGVRIRINDRFALRPEGGMLLSIPSNFIDIRFGVTAIVSW